MTDIRLATPSDALTLARLRYEFRASIHEPTEDDAAFIARCAKWMTERLVAGGPWHCWVLEADGEVAGQLWLQLIEKMPNPAEELELHGYITNVYVRPGRARLRRRRAAAGDRARVLPGAARRLGAALANAAKPKPLRAPRLRGRG